MRSARFTPGLSKGGQLSPNTVGLNAGCFGSCFQWDKEAMQLLWSTFEQKRKLMQRCGPVLSVVIGGTHYGPTFTGQCFRVCIKASLSQSYTGSTGMHIVGLLMLFLCGGHLSCGHLTGKKKQMVIFDMIFFIWWIWIYFTLLPHKHSSNWNIFLTETWSVKCESVLGRRWSHLTGSYIL